MSIKNLFNSNKLPKVSKKKTTDDVKKVIESTKYVETKNTEFNKFVPPIDFSTASNFAKFGSVELYYQKSFERIHNYYPYDGTLHEKTDFENSSSYFDMYVLENLYPRTNGYLEFDGDFYVTVFGGPHTASGGMEGKLLNDTFDYSMRYDEEKRRTSAFEYRGQDGITIEFWLKKQASSLPSGIEEEVIMDVWNGFTTTPDYGRISLSLSPSNDIKMLVTSGSDAFTETLFENAVDGTWNHYAVTLKTSGSLSYIKSYKNSSIETNTTNAVVNGDIVPTTKGLNANVGGPMTDYPNSAVTFTNLDAAMDELRFWKKERTHEEIYNTWFIPVGGGTNKYDSNIDLSLYFKFNEGKTEDPDIDTIVLDYSGRINNGYMTGSSFAYSSAYRNTGSAIRQELSQPEFLDPIIYSSHPDVVSTKAEYVASGSLIDISNTSMMYRYLPTWMQEEDEQNGKNLKYLTQIMASHLDTMWHQIDYLNKIKDNRYIQGGEKPIPFAKKLLEGEGFYMPDLFSDATILERFRDKDDNEIYEESIEDVKNIIYQNLYNGVKYIHKSKGTEKSFRNFFNSLGIGQDVVKINKYADDSTFVLRDNYEYKSTKKRYLNFSLEDNWGATLYTTSSYNDGYIPGDKNFTGSFSMETEIFLPDKRSEDSVLFSPYSQITSSIMGFHATGSTSIYDFPSTDYNVSVFVVRDRVESVLAPKQKQRIKFVISGAFGEVESDFFNNQYSGNKWNIALRLKHEGYPFNNVSGSDEDSYTFELYGVESEANDKLNSFMITASATRDDYSADKVFYAGAHRTNFSGSVLDYTDINLGHVRYWQSYMSNNALEQNSYDPTSMGINEPFENDLVNAYSIEIPREKTLAFNWAFSTITGSNSLGAFTVPDLSSGSLNSDYGSLSNTIQRYVPANAENFVTSSANVVNSEFLFTAAKRRPDDLMSSDLITIKEDETKNFFVDEDVSDNFYSFEKSMYAAVSDEMMNLLTTAMDYNNLIGQPNQKYHVRYNMLDFLRDRFFEDVQNEPDLEKFTSFYKWIDDSISIALEQLVPAGSRFSEKVNNIIESHLFERSKYQHKFPLITDFESTEGSIRGISEMKYNWRYGHAPVEGVDEEQHNCLWQRERKKKDSTREPFRTTKNNHSIQSAGIVRHDIEGTAYLSDVYAIRKFAKLYDVNMVSQNTIHGGPNFSRRKNMMLFHEAIAPNGALGELSSAPQNIITVGVGEGDGLLRKTRCEDAPETKKRFASIATVGNLFGNEYGSLMKGDEIMPMSLMSGTVHTGFNKIIKSFFASDVVISNLHNDVVGRSNDIGMQGPFTNAHVGGLKYRHIDVNRHDTSKSVSYVTSVSGIYPSASIEFDVGVLETKYLLGTSSWVQVRDADGTTVKATYSSVYDIYDNQWRNMDDLVRIFNNKLDITLNKVSDSVLNLTQSSTGSSYNYTIQEASHGFITSSGFSGGTNIVETTSTRNLDSRNNRGEGWGLVFKDHPSQGDNDGALGFIGADYGTPYPYTEFVKAAGYREEVAKRPLNIRNIKTTTASAQVGNYKHGREIFQVQPYHQKTWAKRAYEDPNIDLLPTFDADNLPDTTHYQTLVSREPNHKGNVFGTMNNNRQVDKTNPSLQSFAIRAPETSQGYAMTYDGSVSGYSTTGPKSFITWVNLDSDNSDAKTLFYSATSVGSEVFWIFIGKSGTNLKVVARFYDSSGNRDRHEWILSDYSNFVNQWNHIAIVWNGDFDSNTSGFTLFLNSSSQGNPTQIFDFGTGTSMRNMFRLSLFDSYQDNQFFELQGAMMNAGIYSDELSQVEINQIYNDGVANDYPVVTNNLVDWWALGNDLPNPFVGADARSLSTTIPSVGGSASNTLTIVAGTGLIVVAKGLQTNSMVEEEARIQALNNVITRPRTDLTGSEHNITTRFSAPGGPEVQSIGYLDAYSQTFSAHNAMPFRNLSVLGSGSGEQGTIRVTDHLGLRRGLKTLRGLHMGKFGVDSQYGQINSSNYEASASYNKQHRNRSRRMEYSGTSIITGSNYDNDFINTPIPRSELQYSWIKAATSGSDAPTQNILGYAPKDGIISSSAGWVDAIVFPTASSIFED